MWVLFTLSMTILLIESTSGSSEETESDSSETHSLEPHVDIGMMLSGAEASMRAQSRTLDRLQREGEGRESTSSDESDELSLDEMSKFYIHDPNASGIRVSKWQLKGKRNVYNFGRRPIDMFAHRMYLAGRGRSLSKRVSNSLNDYHETDYKSNDVDFIDDDFDPHTQGISKRGYFPLHGVAKRPNFIGQNMIDWEELAWGRPFRGYCEKRGGCFNPMFVGRN
ncbi:hypothetical protein Cgig2_023312 [Carnegiea gigantea]|uniref:Uncharacterized protein n=1 Tax=Carnegiea gigantea TaxID=171969 RepID=A0A9Q1GYY0_9CARY|nr:hypothetical protein Cgig2_023312 [Carnegiea gigantea]